MGKYLSKEYLLENKDKITKIVMLIIIICVALFVFLFKTGEKEELPVKNVNEASATKEKASTKTVIADVSGAVKEPKVVELKQDSRIDDAIKAAGGLLENADISNINRAAIVSDGDKIFIPEKGKEGESNSQTNTGEIKSKVNINTATTTELQTLNGVGPATAEKILLYRASNGGFNKIEDLKKISGIGDKTFEKMKEFICI